MALFPLFLSFSDTYTGKKPNLQKAGLYKWEPVQIAKLIRHENIQQKNKPKILSALEHEPILSLYREIRHIQNNDLQLCIT